MSRTVRTRIAPSPTGPFHVGNLRTALFNYLFAHRHGGQFILRLDDTDRNRSARRWEEATYRDLAWAGLRWDEGPDRGGPHGPYRQSERGQLYRAAVERLAAAGAAYPCYCPPEMLEAERQASRRAGRPYHYSGRCRELDPGERRRLEAAGRRPAWRFRTPHERRITFSDGVRGEIAFPGKDVGDFVIERSDGSALYNLASVVDDGAMAITHIIRAEEHLSNTPEQVLLCQALELPLPQFIHVGLVLNQERKKLSKRDGSVFVAGLREAGYLPQALLNFLALLGWSPGSEEEIFSLSQLVARFSVAGLAAHGAVFDLEKLTSMNRRYLRDLPAEAVAEEAVPFLIAAGHFEAAPLAAAWERYVAVVRLLRDDSGTLAELARRAAVFYGELPPVEPELATHLTAGEAPEVLTAFARELEALPALEPEAIRRSLQAVAAAVGAKGRALYMPLRIALTGAEHGPPLHETVACLRREAALKRLRRALAGVREPSH